MKKNKNSEAIVFIISLFVFIGIIIGIFCIIEYESPQQLCMEEIATNWCEENNYTYRNMFGIVQFRCAKNIILNGREIGDLEFTPYVKFTDKEIEDCSPNHGKVKQ